jgi:hypothetical protein
MEITNLDYAAGALALMLHFIFKGIIDDGSFLNSLKQNWKYILTSTLTTTIGFLGAEDLTAMMGFASPFTFCVTWGAGAGSIFYNVFKFEDKVLLKSKKNQDESSN